MEALVAAIAALSAITVAVIQAGMLGRRIGKPNGHGPVTKHLSELSGDIAELRAELRGHVVDNERHGDRRRPRLEPDDE